MTRPRPAAQKKPAAIAAGFFHGAYGVADGTRTRDNRNHNPGLYQLSYSHREEPEIIGHVSAEARTRRLRQPRQKA